MYQRKDHYYKKAKEEGLASRAAFKLKEVQDRYGVIRPGDTVADLGCAPGGWLQILAELVGPNGKVIGIDREEVTVKLPQQVSVITADVTLQETIEKLQSALGGRVDVIVSDLAPHTSGIKFLDSYRSYELAMEALRICKALLKNGGRFVVKIFAGKELTEFKNTLACSFKEVIQFNPKATRKGSKEVYLIGKGFGA